MKSLKQQFVALKLKLNQLEPKPDLLAEKEIPAKYLQKSNHDAHSLPNEVKRNDAPSSIFMKNSVKHRNRSVEFCDKSDPGAKASGYLN